MTDAPNDPIAKALFVRLVAQDGKADEVEQFLRDGLTAVMEEPDTASDTPSTEPPGVVDIHSGAAEIALDGTPYSTW